MPRKVTINEVAQAVGCSPATVSLVLNNKPARISPETAQRVHKVARQLGYTPSNIARSLRQGHTKTLGIISDGVTTHRYASALLRGALDTADELGYSVIMTEIDNDLTRFDAAVESMVNNQVEGIVVALMRARLIHVAPPPIPTVIANGGIANHQDIPHILPDEYHGALNATNYLLSLDHRRIGIIGRFPETPTPEVSLTIPDRFRGIDKAVRDASAEVIFECPGADWEPTLGRAAAQALLPTFSSATAPTAIIAANDRIAFGFHQELLEQGIHIPRDLSLLSFDNEDLASYVHPGLTTVEIPYTKIGGTAILKLVDLPSTRNQLLPIRALISMPLIERASTDST